MSEQRCGGFHLLPAGGEQGAGADRGKAGAPMGNLIEMCRSKVRRGAGAGWSLRADATGGHGHHPRGQTEVGVPFRPGKHHSLMNTSASLGRRAHLPRLNGGSAASAALSYRFTQHLIQALLRRDLGQPLALPACCLWLP